MKITHDNQTIKVLNIFLTVINVIASAIAVFLINKLGR